MLIVKASFLQSTLSELSVSSVSCWTQVKSSGRKGMWFMGWRGLIHGDWGCWKCSLQPMWWVIICTSSFRYFRQYLPLSVWAFQSFQDSDSGIICPTAAIISLFWWFCWCLLAILFSGLLVAVWLWLNPSGFLSKLKECGFNTYSAQKAKAETRRMINWVHRWTKQ